MFFIRMKGLPWHSSVEDVFTFFKGIDIDQKWVHIIKMPDGRDSGECLVGVPTQNEFEMCLSFDKHYMGKRYIELYEASQQEWDRVTNRIHRTNKVPINPNSFVLLMRGLPYSAQEDDCISFFGGINCLGVHLTKDKFGRPSGQGYAEFESEDDFTAALEFDRSHMQNRYIELFKSTHSDLLTAMRNQKESKFRRQNNNNYNVHVGGQYAQVGGARHAYHNHPNNDREKKFVVSMIGLAPESSEGDIRLFFEIEDVFPLRIHMKSDCSECFVELRNLEEQQKAISLSRSQINGRIVEVLRCEWDELVSKIGHVPRRQQRHKFSKKDPGLTLPIPGPRYIPGGGGFFTRPDSPAGHYGHPAFPFGANGSPTGFLPPISPVGGGFQQPGSMGYSFSPPNYASHYFSVPQQSVLTPTGMNSPQSPLSMPFPLYSPNPSLNSSFFFPPGGMRAAGMSTAKNHEGFSSPSQSAHAASYTYTPRR